MEAMLEINSYSSADGTPRMDLQVVVENKPSQLIFTRAASEGGIPDELNRTQVQETQGAPVIKNKEGQCCPEYGITKGKGVHCDAAVDWAELLGQSPASPAVEQRKAGCFGQLRGPRPGVSRDVAKADVDTLLFHKLKGLKHAIRQKAVYVNTLQNTAQRCYQAWKAVPPKGLGEDADPEEAVALQTYEAAWLETDAQVIQLDHMREVLGVMERDAHKIAANMEDALVGGWACEDCFDINRFMSAD